MSESTEKLVVLTAELMADAAASVHRALRNLSDLEPGFGSTTPGNGSPGGGKGARVTEVTDREGTDWVPVTSVEASVLSGRLVDDDRALRAERQIARMAKLAHRAARELRDLCLTYDYPVGGEFGRPRTGQATETVEQAEKWCTSCARLHRAESRYRGELCRWCYDFTATEKIEPPLDILDAHHRGMRITTAMVAAAKRAPKPSTVKLKTVTRRRRRVVERPSA